MTLTALARAGAYFAANAVEPHYYRGLADTVRARSATPSQRAAIVGRTLHRYLLYCLRYSRFWQERWPREARRFDVQDAEHVLSLLPTLTKEDVRAFAPQLRIIPAQRTRGDGFPAAPGAFEQHSGGSTGIPTTVWQDRRFAARDRAVIDAAYLSTGLVPGAATFFLWGSNAEISDLAATRRKRVSTWLRGLIPMPSFALDADKASAYARLIAHRDDADSAICFVSALDSFLGIAQHEGIALRRIRRVVTGGGTLTADLRRRIVEQWADEVFDKYGARDAGMIGMEAAGHDGIELYPWHNYVEVLRDGRRVVSGESGEVHVTCVQNYAFALIRLAMGDVGRMQPGGPNASDARLQSLLGRTAERLRTADGGYVDPAAVIHLIGVLEARPWLRRFQVEQRSATDVRLRVETWEAVGAPELADYSARLREALGRVLGAPIALEVEVVDAIAPLHSGKHSYVLRWGPS